MKSSRHAGVGAAAIAIGLAGGAGAMVAGCSHGERAARVGQGVVEDGAVTQASFVARDSGADGAMKLGISQVAPKRCGMAIAILSRPEGDPAVGDRLWSAVDEQAIPIEAIRGLEANGIRLGLIAGGLPAEVQGALNPPPPGLKTDIVTVDRFDGEPASIDLAAVPGNTTLVLNRKGRALGKDYDEAKGLLRVVASHDGTGGVRVEIVPEIRHGPTVKGYAAAPGSPYAPKEFVLKEGQAEESLGDVAATVRVKPGQVLAIGMKGDSNLALGHFLFTKAEANTDRVERRVVLIWAQAGAALGEGGVAAAAAAGSGLDEATENAPKPSRRDRRANSARARAEASPPKATMLPMVPPTTTTTPVPAPAPTPAPDATPIPGS